MGECVREAQDSEEVDSSEEPVPFQRSKGQTKGHQRWVNTDLCLSQDVGKLVPGMFPEKNIFVIPYMKSISNIVY